MTDERRQTRAELEREIDRLLEALEGLRAEIDDILEGEEEEEEEHPDRLLTCPCGATCLAIDKLIVRVWIEAHRDHQAEAERGRTEEAQ